MNRRPLIASAAAILAATVAAPLAGCAQPSDNDSGRKWYGAAVSSPHTRTATLLGKSAGPYLVRCSGTGDDLTVDVSAPDGWSAVFRSPAQEWTLRKTRGSEVARMTGSEDGVSFLAYDEDKYVIDSEVFTSPPRSWDIGDDLVRISMYIDCAPPPERQGAPRPSVTQSVPRATPEGPEKGQGAP